MKQFLSILLSLVLILSLTACGTTAPTKTQSPETQAAETQSPETEPTVDLGEAVKLPEPDVSGANVENFGDSELFKLIEGIVQTSFEGFDPQVTYDQENHLMNIVIQGIDGMAMSVAMAAETPELAEEWTLMTDSLLEVTNAGYSMLSEAGLEIGCTIMMLSDVNPENALYAAINGIEVHNALTELQK